MADQARRAATHRRLVRYIEALSGRLDLAASFSDHTVATTEAA